MMGLLAGLLSGLSGPLVRYLLIACAGLMAVTGIHLTIENWKGNLRAEGQRQCDAAWEQRIRNEARAAAEADLNASRSLLENERRTTESLYDRITQMQDELDRVRAGATGGDERCLSDRVLQQLGKPAVPVSKPGPRQKTPSS